ncbi:MAG: hypothetical protein FWD97_08670, partial [Defluviitaleaceae bacterium]|nr:hypothetical protein [Defluviitaleaceae bacterium]
MIKSGRRTFMVLLLVTFVLMVTIVVIIVASRNVYDPIELQGTFIHEHNIFEHIFLVFDEGTFRTYGRVAEELTQGEPRLMYWGQGILVASDDGTYYTMYA